MWVVAVPVGMAIHRPALVDHEAGNAHRIDADDHGGIDLDRELDAHLVALPEILELRRLTLGQADICRRPVAGDDTHRIGLEAKPAPDVGDRDVWARCEISAETRCARPFGRGHELCRQSTPASPMAWRAGFAPRAQMGARTLPLTVRRTRCGERTGRWRAARRAGA